MRAIRLITLALLTLMNLPHNAFAQDKDGHVLTRLWADYGKAEDADRPQDQVRILEQIKKEATTKHLAWDFYDACIEYIEVRSDIDWKDHDAVRKQTEEEMERFGEPVVLFHYRMEEEEAFDNWRAFRQRLPGLLAYVQEHRAQMERARNVAFYEDCSSLYRPEYYSLLRSRIRNDYEYALWGLLIESDGPALAQQVAREFPPQDYPLDALLAFTLLRKDGATDDAAYEKYAADHAGQAVALLARDLLLQRRFDALDRKEAPTQEEYLQLARDCEALQADRKKFSGSEKAIADCCTDAGHIL